MAKITMKSSVSVAENFEDYILTRKAKGLADKTLTTYKQHFSAICKHLDADKPIDKLTKTDLDEMIASMRDAGLSSNKMVEILEPETIICYGDTFEEMEGNILSFPYSAFRKKVK